MLLGVGGRAAADVWIYAFLPVYLHVQLREERLWLVSLVLTAPALIRWLTAPGWGRAADASPRPQRLLAAGLLGYGGLLAGLPFISRPEAVIVFVAAATAFGSAFNPVARAMVSLWDRDRSLLDLAAWHQWEAGGYLLAGLVMGPALVRPGVFEAVTTGTALLLFFCALWLLLRSGTAGYAARRPPPDPPAQRPSRPVPVWTFRCLWPSVAAPWRRAILFLFVASFVWEAVAAVFGLYFTQAAGASPGAFGFVISASTGLSLLLYKPLARWGRRASADRLFTAAAGAASVMYGLMAVPAAVSVAVGYMVPFTSIVRTAFNALLVTRVPARRRGEFLGTMEATESAAAVFGPLAGGAGADRFGLGFVPLFALVASLPLHFLVTRSAPDP